MGSLTVAAAWMNAVLDGLEREGISRRALTDGLRGLVGGRAPETALLEVGLARRIWCRAHELSPDPLLGIKVGAAMPIQATNVLAVVQMHSATFGEALDHLFRFQGLLSDSGQFAPVGGGGRFRVTYVPADSIVSIDPLQVDSVVSSLVARGVRPLRVRLPARANGDPSAFAERLGCPVGLGADLATIDYDRAALARPIFGADSALRDINIAYAESMLASRRRLDSLCGSVRAAIGKLGPRASVETVAAQLGLSTRTLQRRLNEAGASFKGQLQAYRMDEALLLLTESTAGMEQIAQMLGYAEISAFSRAVSDWWGRSPRALRKDRATPGRST